jgi:HSP20 family protein
MPCDPLRDLRAWQERLERLAHPRPELWAPPIDIYETAAAYIITVEVPGVARENVDLAVEESRLVIRGRRSEERGRDAETVRYHLVERGHGTFTRSFEFAQKVDIQGVGADLTDGVLTITLPKIPPPAPRRIEVR